MNVVNKRKNKANPGCNWESWHSQVKMMEEKVKGRKGQENQEIEEREGGRVPTDTLFC